MEMTRYDHERMKRERIIAPDEQKEIEAFVAECLRDDPSATRAEALEWYEEERLESMDMD
jgi:hypothetical protein